jgi:hypothetical protein
MRGGEGEPRSNDSANGEWGRNLGVGSIGMDATWGVHPLVGGMNLLAGILHCQCILLKVSQQLR